MKSRFWTVILIIVIPYIAIVGLFPWYNRAEPFIFGVPFVYFWIFSWFFLTSLCMYIGWRIDRCPFAPGHIKKRSSKGGK